MNKLLTLFIALCTFGQTALAQSLLPAATSFSHKKTSYITLKDGSTVEGTIKDLDRKKLVIDEVKLKTADGKVVKLKPEDIAHMYLPESGLSKVSNAADFFTDANRWDNKDLDGDLVSQGYVYFESTEVIWKKKRLNLLLQLLNPHFAEKIKVYNDPLAGETMSAGIGPVKLIGGLDKSYYVLKSEAKAAIRLKKKHYDDEFKGFYSSCKAVSSQKPKWEDFVSHVYKFAKECK